MAAEFIVATRRALPARTQPWHFDIEGAAGAVAVHEVPPGDADFARGVAELVGWAPQAIVCVRKAWELAQVVAEELAQLLAGAVYCDVDGVVFFDAREETAAVTSLAQLEQRLRHAFDHPQPFFERWQREEQARFVEEQARDPDVAAANDWSDLD